MDANDIIEKRFDKGFNGYRMEDVDEFLQEMSSEFAALQRQNDDMEKKMEVLADKIREYRSDEDAIKEALLDARKQSSSVVSAAKEKAENMEADAKAKSDKMISDAQTKSDNMIKDAEAKVREKEAYCEKLVADANAEKDRIVAECERKSADIQAQMEAEIKKLESIIAKTRDESNAYLDRLMKQYQEHIDFVKSIPEKCENDYIKNVKDTLKPAEAPKPAPTPAPAPVTVQQTAEVSAPTPVTEPEPEPVQLQDTVSAQPENEIEEEIRENEDIFLERTTDIAYEPAFADGGDDEEDDELPLFDKSKHKSRFEKLKFGSNNKDDE